MGGQSLRDRFREGRRDQPDEREQTEKVRAPRDHMEKIHAAKARKDRAKAEVAAADEEIGELFAQLIERDWDLKAAAAEVGISRTLVYRLVGRVD